MLTPILQLVFHILGHPFRLLTEPWGPRVAPRIYTSASWHFNSRSHFQHFWCERAAVTDIDTGTAPAGAAAAAVSRSLSHLSSPAPQRSVAPLNSPRITDRARRRKHSFPHSFLVTPPVVRRLQPNFLITAVWLQQKRWENTPPCPSELTPTWHSKVHNSVSESELRSTSVAT